MRNFLTDLRYSWRALLRRPLFALTAVLTLALAIGGNLTIGSMLYTRFVAALPYPHSERLVVLSTQLPNIGVNRTGVPAFDYARWTTIDAVEASTAYTSYEPALLRNGESSRVKAAAFAQETFALLGAQPVLGGPFGADNVDGVLLSDRIWRREFSADPRVIGTTLRMDGETLVVRGVMPATFELPDAEADYFVQRRFKAEELAKREWRTDSVLLRLKPDATLQQAQAQLTALEAAHLAHASDEADFHAMTGYAPLLGNLREYLHGELRPALMLLQWAVLGVLLLACANVAHLQLLRASQRRSELGLRQALGAQRARLARLVFSESLLLATVGAALGLVVAAGATRALAALSTFGTDAALQPGIVIAGAVILCIACAVLCALPAMFGFWRDGTLALRPGSRVTGGAQSMPRLRQVLVIVQTALTVVLLIGAGLLLRSFEQIVSLDPGFHRAGVLTARLQLTEARFTNPADWIAYRERLLDAVRVVPGAGMVSLTDTLPFGESYSLTNYLIDGQAPPAADARYIMIARAGTPEYFATLGIPLLQGRLLAPEDATQANVVVDERFMRRHFPDGNAIGQRIRTGGGDTPALLETIVGVVGNVAQLSLDETDMNPSLYRPYAAVTKPEGFLVVRSELPLSALVAPIRHALQQVDPDEPPRDIVPLQTRIDDTLQDRRSPLLLLGLFAAVALALAAIGQYGLMAWSVAQRENELGLRMAIGAQRRDILALVLRGGARLTALGLGVGLLLAAATGRVLSAQLYGISALDPLTYATVAALLAGIAFVACLLPALRATRIAPATALRGD